MNGFRMKPKHLIHVPQFDEEHGQLFQIVDLLRQELVKPAGLPTARRTFVILENHARIHFAHEERTMQEFGYPGLPEHREIHTQLLAELEEMTRQLDRWQPLAAKSFNTSLAIWLFGHVTTEDAKLGQFVTAQQLRPAAASPAGATHF